MNNSKIIALYDEYKNLISFCQQHKQISFELYIDNIYKKSLLLSAASLFETEISNAIRDFALAASNENNSLVAFVENKAIKRQYHTFFSWDDKNANQFLGLFGEDFKQKARAKIEERNLKDAEKAFLAIGKDRNYLVHRNYIEININSTFDEIYNRYVQACDFVEFIIEILNETR